MVILRCSRKKVFRELRPVKACVATVFKKCNRQPMSEGLREFLRSASRGGGKNFRTIGGFPAADGQHVAAGRVYRSGHLGELAGHIGAELGSLDVHTIVTFQTRKEIDILGDSPPALLPAAAWEHIPIGDRWFEDDWLVEDWASQGDFYLAMVRDHASHWARFLRVFTREASFPVLYHCTAGRDRTGVATVLLLESLRVSRSVIVADYLLSNEVFQENVQEASVLDPLFGAIDERGGIDRFLGEIGLVHGEIEAIRSNLLVR